jgi:DNA-binding YbaB/EbfC family protein
MKGFGGIGDMGKLMKQAQEMKRKMEEAQEILEKETVTGSAGGGMVKATVNGKLRVVHLEIDPEVVNPEDVDMLRDLIVAAVNDGQTRAQEMAMDKTREMMGPAAGMFGNLPGFGA